MLKVAKFGGSSMADAKQFEKVRDIVRADPARKVIVVSASGKRSADDHKLTDLLYLCYAHLQYGVSCDAIFQMICDRYIAIRDKVEKLREQSEQRKAQADSISAFMFEMHETDEPVTEFDGKLWTSVIDSVVVRHNGTLLFRFRNGMEIEG